MFDLPKKRILRRQDDFVRVRQNGLRLECGSFVFFAGKTGPDTRPARLGVVTSRKAVGDATVRNRARRIFKSVFRTHPACLPAGWDAVVVVRGDPDRVPYAKHERRFLGACSDAVRKAAGGTGLREPAPVAPTKGGIESDGRAAG